MITSARLKHCKGRDISFPLPSPKVPTRPRPASARKTVLNAHSPNRRNRMSKLSVNRGWKRKPKRDLSISNVAWPLWISAISAQWWTWPCRCQRSSTMHHLRHISHHRRVVSHLEVSSIAHVCHRQHCPFRAPSLGQRVVDRCVRPCPQRPLGEASRRMNTVDNLPAQATQACALWVPTLFLQIQPSSRRRPVKTHRNRPLPLLLATRSLTNLPSLLSSPFSLLASLLRAPLELLLRNPH